MYAPAWKYYGSFYKASWRALCLSVLISIAQSLIVLPIAFLVRHVFDEIIPGGEFRFLLLAGLAIFLLYVLNDALALWTRYLTLKVTKIAIRQVREEMIKTFYTFSKAYYSEADQGRLHSIIVQDTERLDVMSYNLVAQFLPALFTATALGIVLTFLHWYLFLVMIVVLPILFLASRPMGKMVREWIKLFRRSFETFSKEMLFVLQAMDLTRIQTAEHVEIEKQKQYLENLRITSGRMSWLNYAYQVVQNTITTASGVVILIIGGTAVAAGSMSLGELLSFYVAFGLLRSHLRTLSSSIPHIIAGNESLITLYEISKSEDLNPYSGTKKMTFGGRITLESVYFQYKGRPFLRNINLSIAPGSIVAIVGPNGAGKSTIVNLILGFYRPQKGTLSADDICFSELDIVDFRRHIAVVMQNPFIFPGTILENITYGGLDIAPELVEYAANLASAHEFIQKLPQGYDTFVGDNGALLSGGQRQRIAVARALARQPKLLILDEPTNHLDRAAVRQLMNNLREMDDRPAILIISHDTHVVAEAQTVYALQDGSMVKIDDYSAHCRKTSVADLIAAD